ncbi:MAG: AMP-binding protein [Deltaproteobacteria bacterium]|nr:AMP-binding protein [Deltaproteobacteria bacterium]MBW2359410.1 AMP-binding protein [Deltaproteobacteria bacterium]
MLTADGLWNLIEKRAGATPDALFAVDEAERRLSFEEYRAAVLRCAAGLRARGVGVGDCISWQLPTSIDALVLCGALARLGAVQNPILPIYREREVGFVVRQLESKLLVVPGTLRGFDHAAMARQLAAQQQGLAVVDLSEGLPDADPAGLGPAPDPNGVLRWVLYSSGTTADPKGAKHTDQTLLAASRGFAERLALAPDDRVALVFPLTHVGGIGWLMNGLLSGCAQLVVASFDPATTIPFLAAHGVTQATAGTVFHQAYLAAQRRQPDTPLFPAIRTFPGGGAPKPPQLYTDLLEEMGAPICSGYGLTECPVPVMNGVDDPDEKRAHTEGRASPLGTEIRIVSHDETLAAAGQEGEVRVRAPQMCLGYWDAALDADAFDAEGFLRTGDLGNLDAEGFLSISGRLKDVIIRKGENISAKEVEDLLYTHESLQDVAVIGLPDPDAGERACAVVVLADPSVGFALEDAVAHLEAAGLMRQKFPERLEVVEALPRNPTGKVLKHELRMRFSE